MEDESAHTHPRSPLVPTTGFGMPTSLLSIIVRFDSQRSVVGMLTWPFGAARSTPVLDASMTVEVTRQLPTGIVPVLVVPAPPETGTKTTVYSL